MGKQQEFWKERKHLVDAMVAGKRVMLKTINGRLTLASDLTGPPSEYVIQDKKTFIVISVDAESLKFCVNYRQGFLVKEVEKEYRDDYPDRFDITAYSLSDWRQTEQDARNHFE